MSKLFVKSIINTPVSSNCFIVYNVDSSHCVIVDPGSKDCSSIEKYLFENDLLPDYVILTHEHFDHIWGVNSLRYKFGFKLVATRYASEAIPFAKKNLSAFYCDGEGFSIMKTDIVIEKDCVFTWNGIDMHMIMTPGHTKGGLSILVENNLFVGDLIMKDIPPVFKLPGSSVLEYEQSLYKLSKVCRCNGRNVVLKCGHGEDILIDKENYDKIFGFTSCH